jgi:hypothetical protein
MRCNGANQMGQESFIERQLVASIKKIDRWLFSVIERASPIETTHRHQRSNSRRKGPRSRLRKSDPDRLKWASPVAD